MASPLFKRFPVPLLVRFALALILTLLLAPTLWPQLKENTFSTSAYLFLFLKELFLGVLIGWVFTLLFEAVGLAGQIIGNLCGLSSLEILDPLGMSEPLLAGAFRLFAMVLFFGYDLHHAFLHFLSESYLLFPLNYFLPPLNFSSFIDIFSQLFIQAFTFIAPLFLLLYLLLMAFAVVSRFLPQFPIFWIGFSIQLLVGLLLLSGSLVDFPAQLREAFGGFAEGLQKIFLEVLGKICYYP